MEPQTSSSQHTAGLVRKLCVKLAPTKSQGDAAQLFQYALRILGSYITPSIERDELHLVDIIKKKLVREGRAPAAATFAEFYRKLSAQPVLRDRWAILLLLFNASEEAKVDTGKFNLVQPQHGVLLSSKAGLPKPESDTVTTKDAVLDVLAAQSRPGGAEKNNKRKELLKQHRKDVADLYENTSFELLEHDLLRDLVFVFQGIDGKYIKFDAAAEIFAIDRKVGVPRPLRDHVSKLAELGWLFVQVKRYLAIHAKHAALGLVSQAFCSALHAEESEHYRLMAVLEGQAFMGSDRHPNLTLKRLTVWTYEPTCRMRWLALIVDACTGLKGGALCTKVHSFTHHGDPRLLEMVTSLMSNIAKPIFAMLKSWIFEGELRDPYNEFFIASDPTVNEEMMWEHRYQIRLAMLPSFISVDLARKILIIGKTINFMRNTCNDNAVLTVETGSVMDFSYVKQGSLEAAVRKAYEHTSKRLLDILYNKYNLLEHLNALRRYLLLGQGDFIRHLLDLLEQDLEQPATTLFVHNLSGVLETAIRATNAQYDRQETLSRLDVRLLESSADDRGWDVFSLTYRVDGPLGTILTQGNMLQYLTVFNFLWRAKRMEYCLSSSWKNQMVHARQGNNIPEIRGVMMMCQSLGAEMNHFINQIQHYLVFEVLECAWVELTARLERAADLDELIGAHKDFLQTITRRTLLGRESQKMLSQLRSIFDLVIEYQTAQMEVYTSAAEEQARRNKYVQRTYEKSLAGHWGATEDDTVAQESRKAKFTHQEVPKLRAKVKIVSEAYEDMVGRFLVMLANHSDPSLHALSFRLDFNEHYRKAIPEFAEALSPFRAKKQRSRTAAGPSSLRQMQVPPQPKF